MILFCIYVVLSSLGLILVKMGANGLHFDLQASFFSFSMSWITLVGFFCYLISFLIWMVLISKSDLSYIAPLGVACTNIAILVGSKYILHENLTWGTVVGMAIILIGIFIIQFTKSR